MPEKECRERFDGMGLRINQLLWRGCGPMTGK